MGRWVFSLSTGIIDISRVFLVAVSNVLMPLSHRITFSLPPAIMYSALISSSATVLASPRFKRIGLSIVPSSFRSLKFCIFLAPTCITSTSSNISRSVSSMISVTIGRPVAFLASRRYSIPVLPSP